MLRSTYSFGCVFVIEACIDSRGAQRLYSQNFGEIKRQSSVTDTLIDDLFYYLHRSKKVISRIALLWNLREPYINHFLK